MKLKISQKDLIKKEEKDSGSKDPKGRKISFKYFINKLEVEEDSEQGSGVGWSLYTFREGPGTYYGVTTTKLRNGEVFGATFNTKYVRSEEEAIRIGEDYIKKGLASERRKLKKLSPVPESFKEFYRQ